MTDLTLAEDFAPWWELYKYRDYEIPAREFGDQKVVYKHGSNRGWPGDDIPQPFTHQGVLIFKYGLGWFFFVVSFLIVNKQANNIEQACKPCCYKYNVQ